MKPKITVTTSTYQRPDLLARCIVSVQRQTFKEYEHIIFADHCPYAEKVYNEFKNDKRIRFKQNDQPKIKNVGAVGHNWSLDNANTEFMAYCDDDNIYLPNALEVMYQGLQDGHPVVQTRAIQTTWGRGGNSTRKMMENATSDLTRLDVDDEGIGVNETSKKWKGIGQRPRRSCRDILQIAHKITELRWETYEEIGRNEDGHFMHRLFPHFNLPSIDSFHQIEKYTGIYYGRGESNLSNPGDTSYKNQLLKLGASPYVFPEIVKQLRSLV